MFMQLSLIFELDVTHLTLILAARIHCANFQMLLHVVLRLEPCVAVPAFDFVGLDIPVLLLHVMITLWQLVECFVTAMTFVGSLQHRRRVTMSLLMALQLRQEVKLCVAFIAREFIVVFVRTLHVRCDVVSESEFSPAYWTITAGSFVVDFFVPPQVFGRLKTLIAYVAFDLGSIVGRYIHLVVASRWWRRPRFYFVIPDTVVVEPYCVVFVAICVIVIQVYG